MSEPVVKERQTIDFDDFEPRLHAADTGRAHDDDPLAELARLVGNPHDPYQDVFAQEASIRPEANYASGLDHRREPAFDAGASAPRFSGSFADIEAGLRGNLPAYASPADAADGAIDYRGFDQHGTQAHDSASWAQEKAVPPTSSSWTRRPVTIVAATIAVGVIGIGGAFALKGHGTTPGEVKTIMADAGPTKIQPPADAQADPLNQDSAVLAKGNPTTPSKLVSNEEQPVELSQAVQENAARDAHATDASTVAVPQSPDQLRSGEPATQPNDATGSIGDQGSSFGMAGMPEPKKVKVVSVRPDGTILPNDQPPADMSTVPQPPMKAASSKSAAPKSAAPKTTSRVPPTVTSLAATDDATAAPAAPKTPKSHKAKPIHVASADPGDVGPATDAAATKPAASASHVSFAVQLAAPGSESEAKSASSRLAKKFADALGGRPLAFHKAQSNGKSVYRVRVGSLSKEDAVSLCEKLKADGGSCFVARN